MSALIRPGTRQVAPVGEKEAVSQGQQYLTFTVSGEEYAIPISAIKEIIEYRQPTEVPMMPHYIRGVINLRGRVVPVIDLAVRFGRAKDEASKRTCIVILEIAQENQQQDISVVVDAVHAVADIADANVEPPPKFGARLRTDFISGMGKIGEQFVIILDVDRVLSVEELSSLDGMGEGQTPALAAPEALPAALIGDNRG
jgi:purine-binding chemotaxis protein CheW